ncbi:endonuclease/exonuclease/phosphatase family protein [Tropicibacter oceani]|uniref:Endonuclease/exonuclease/phosphatase family protein n=1 Tax=Tropicibacter oceani TaxID=3058420 RepID=A0ABY8QLN1_9RHOB|nr:endonuclease/exonuclease/phosphatase family protein [Tropicibacter oceani]WGW04722.1 endonuclease/exonuclease/phosphatase family protein [Tropicibacter oceani]
MASYAGEFSRKGPGLLLRDLLRDDPVPGIETIANAAPEILLLTDFDYDAGHAALQAFQDRIAARGLDLPYRFALRPNTGMTTGLDLDGDGRKGGPRDAQGFGYFAGQGGQAILSRWPLTLDVDLSTLLWRDVPDSLMAKADPGPELQRLSTSAHWSVFVQTPQGAVRVMTIGATPPVFDGPEDRNGRRNRDEVLLWVHHLDGRLGERPGGPAILLGNLNLDPQRGDGLREAAARVLAHPELQDPLPDRPTVQWDGPGEMRVTYVLPTRDWQVLGAGITPPEQDAGPHRLVWVDLAFPR